MKAIWKWIQRWFGKLWAEKLPKLKRIETVFRDSNSNMKVCSVACSSGGVLFTPYHNFTRRDSWIFRWDGNKADVLASFAAGKDARETVGTPDRVGDWWIYPSESHGGRVIGVHDRTGHTRTYMVQPAAYSTRCVEGVIAFSYKSEHKVQLWDILETRKLHEWPLDQVAGIVSGIVQDGSHWIISIMAGDKPCIASTRGWRIAGKYVDIIELNGELLCFAKSGEVEVRGLSNGKKLRTICDTDNKPQRARRSGGLVYWVTSNWDQLWVTNGDDVRLLAEWKDGDKPENDGSLFGCSLDVQDDNTLYVARSINGRGYELMKVEVTK